MIKRIGHIGVVVEDLEQATRFWCEAYGLKKYAEYETDVEGVRACLLSVSGAPGEMSIELIEPLNKSDMTNAISRRLAKKGEGFYHLAVHVEDVESSSERLRDKGLEVLHRDPVEGHTGERWLVHPKSSNGILVEGL
jgi:methylmalonyl-CoA/ethylmalonyl-CoA epimerase